MPVLDGYMATQKIRENEKETDYKNVITAMTANAMQGDREKCISYGMDDYISKTLRIDDLIDMLNKWSNLP